MKILVLATDAFGGTGGIAQYMRDIIAAFAGYSPTETVVVIPRIITREPEPLPEKAIHLVEAAGSKLRFVTTVLREASRRNFDWIVCGHVNLLEAALLAASISGARVMLLIYGIEVWSAAGFFRRASIRRVAAIVSISEFTLEKLRRRVEIPAKVATFIVPNAIDLEKFTPGPRNQSIVSRWALEGQRILLTLGRMDAAEQAKGFDEILEALPVIATEFPTVAYLIAGDGTDRKRLESKVTAMSLNDRVRFTGYVDEAEKADYYRLADAFVMPSRLEGFGFVFLEALACGVPVIASKVDGSREAVRNGALGMLVDPSQPGELIAAIRATLRDPFVPARIELEYFSRERFDARCHAVLASLQAGTESARA